MRSRTSEVRKLAAAFAAFRTAGARRSACASPTLATALPAAAFATGAASGRPAATTAPALRRRPEGLLCFARFLGRRDERDGFASVQAARYLRKIVVRHADVDRLPHELVALLD